MMNAAKITNRERGSERGSVMVEFLVIFPAFLVLCMFVLEVGFMWADRHVTRYAAVEAARVYAAANLPDWQNGTPIHNPCESDAINRRAKQAALRRIAIISPTLAMFITRLGVEAHGLDFSDIASGSIVGAARRIAERWPTAAISTEVNCSFDEAKGAVTVDVRYHRMLQTPFIDRVMFLIYKFTQWNTPNNPIHLQLDQNFYGVEAQYVTPAALVQAKAAMSDAIKTVKKHALPLSEAASMLKDVPGVGHILAKVPSAPVDIFTAVDKAESTVNAQIAAFGGAIQNTLDQQTDLLTTLVGYLPSALYRIPLDVRVTLQRDVFTSKAVDANGLKEPAFVGQLKGSTNMSDQSGSTEEFRAWGHELSNPQKDVNLMQGATPLREEKND